MSKSSTIRARMDPQLKKEAETILHELGISTTQALTLFYQQVRLKRGIPFEVRLPDERSGPSPRPVSQRPQPPFPVDGNRSLMEQNVAAYKAMHGELVERYLGQYVAIYDGQLVDYDPDPVALLERVRAQHPNQVVLRHKVERTPKRELRTRHPQIEPLP